MPVLPERWLPVVGYEQQYEVSDRGRVRSLDRIVAYSQSRFGKTISRTHAVKGRLLRPYTEKKGGYQIVHIGYGNPRTIHTLVLEAFIGPRPERQVGCHDENDSSNNQLENLSWDTHAKNIADKERHGTKLIGEKVFGAKLDEFKVREIRAGNRAVSELASTYGVARMTIYKILNGKTWKHIT